MATICKPSLGFFSSNTALLSSLPLNSRTFDRKNEKKDNYFSIINAITLLPEHKVWPWSFGNSVFRAVPLPPPQITVKKIKKVTQWIPAASNPKYLQFQTLKLFYPPHFTLLPLSQSLYHQELPLEHKVKKRLLRQRRRLQSGPPTASLRPRASLLRILEPAFVLSGLGQDIRPSAQAPPLPRLSFHTRSPQKRRGAGRFSL